MYKETNFSLAQRHRKFNPEIMQKLSEQDFSLIKSLSTNEARKAYNWNRQVAGCFHLSRAFMRMKISRHGILYGKVEPEHYVEDLIARWFSNRFPMFTAMVESSRGTFVAQKGKVRKYDRKLSELLPKLESSLPENELLTDIEDFDADSFWEKYYSSQLIRERKNTRYFNHNMPKKYRYIEGMNVEKKSINGNKRLNEFYF